MNFLEKIVYASIFGYNNIDLEPSTQTYTSVIIKGENVFLTNLSEGSVVKVTPEYLINNFCGRLLVNNIDCDGYVESTFIHRRSYDFDTIMNCPLDDFGNYSYLTLLRFSNLCKAIITESTKNNKIYFIEMLYSDGYLAYYDENSEYELFDKIDNDTMLKVAKVLKEKLYDI